MERQEKRLQKANKTKTYRFTLMELLRYLWADSYIMLMIIVVCHL